MLSAHLMCKPLLVTDETYPSFSVHHWLYKGTDYALQVNSFDRPVVELHSVLSHSCEQFASNIDPAAQPIFTCIERLTSDRVGYFEIQNVSQVPLQINIKATVPSTLSAASALFIKRVAIHRYTMLSALPVLAGRVHSHRKHSFDAMGCQLLGHPSPGEIAKHE